jgi:hypothetical protein
LRDRTGIRWRDGRVAWRESSPSADRGRTLMQSDPETKEARKEATRTVERSAGIMKRSYWLTWFVREGRPAVRAVERSEHRRELPLLPPGEGYDGGAIYMGVYYRGW